MKWKTLEHHAMTFPPAYQPLPNNIRMKLKVNGEKVDLPHELEELASWWAEAVGTDFGEKDKVKENFWLDFGKKLDPVSN